MRHVVLAVIVLCGLCGAARRAAAQASAIAEQLFNEARDLAKAGAWAEACPKFEASLRQDPALGTRLNLATCYEHVGKLASAWGLYRESADLATKAGDAKRSDYAQKQALQLMPRLPRLTITAPSRPPPGLVVQRDALVVNAAELGLALYVDPGAHEVTAAAPGFEPFSRTITLVEGKTETLAIPDLTPKPEQPKAKPSTESVENLGERPVSPTRKYVGLGIGGAGVVGAAIGLIVGAQAFSANNKAKQLCGDDLACSAENFEAGKKLVDDGRSKATISTVLTVAGGAAIVAGAVLYFTAPKAPEQRTARLVPIIDRTGAGLGLAGTF
jgi:tetratricopeptide (TPR) repeat protein